MRLGELGRLVALWVPGLKRLALATLGVGLRVLGLILRLATLGVGLA